MINIGNNNAKSYAIFSLTPSSYFTYLITMIIMYIIIKDFRLY